jgi:hypothetical protein
LQVAALVSGFVMATLPAFILNVSWASTIVSLMQYLLVASLILAILGIVWKGRIRLRSALGVVFTSMALGVWMILSITYVQFLTMVFLDEDCCRWQIPTVAPAQNPLWVGLLIPAVTFTSSLLWIVWDGLFSTKRVPALTM